MRFWRTWMLLACLGATVGMAQAQPQQGGQRPDGMRPGGFPANMPAYMVAGAIVDSATQVPLEFVAVDLISIDEQKIVDGLLTDSSGRFRF